MPEQMALGPGDPSSIGEYRLSSRLGEGGQGVVYLATAPSGARVVVKLLRMAGLDDPAARSRLAKEVNAARTVARFCTAQVIAAQIEGEQPYIVSEYVEGPTLSEHVRTRGPLSGSALDRLAIGTATALAAIHQARIVHRDFKPGNVILGPDGARVIDFGIAHDLIGDSTSTAPLLGTPAFTAPEQVSSGAIGPAADLFAWASTMAFAATGRSPFHGESPVAQLHQVLNAEPDLAGVPEPLASVLALCLAKDPAARPTAEQVLLHLLGGVRVGVGVGGGDALAAASALARGGTGQSAGSGAVPGGRQAAPSGRLGPPAPVTPLTPVPPMRPAPPSGFTPATGTPISPASARAAVPPSEAFTERLYLPPGGDRTLVGSRPGSGEGFARAAGYGAGYPAGYRNGYRDGYDGPRQEDYRGDHPDDDDEGYGEEYADGGTPPRRRRRVPLAATALLLLAVLGVGAKFGLSAFQGTGRRAPLAATANGGATGSGAASRTADGQVMTGETTAGQTTGQQPGQGTATGQNNATAGGAAVPPAFVGTWTGLVEQPPGSGQTYAATLTISARGGGSTFSLPALGCTSRLQPATAGGTQQLKLSARTTADPQGRCARAAVITLTPAATGALNLFWQDAANGKNTAVATMARN